MQNKIRLHELWNARPRPTQLIQTNSTTFFRLFTSALEDNSRIFWDHRFNIMTRVYAIYINYIIYANIYTYTRFSYIYFTLKPSNFLPLYREYTRSVFTQNFNITLKKI